MEWGRGERRIGKREVVWGWGDRRRGKGEGKGGWEVECGSRKDPSDKLRRRGRREGNGGVEEIYLQTQKREKE